MKQAVPTHVVANTILHAIHMSGMKTTLKSTTQ